MHENKISYTIRGAIFEVFSKLGPGLLESTYEAALMYELQKCNLRARPQVALPLIYDGVQLEIGYRIDLLVEEKVIIEIKSVETLAEIHHKQILTYLKLSGLKLGILVNFNCIKISENIFRKVNGL